MLAFSLFALVLRFTKSKWIAYCSIAGWFLVSGLQGGELGSYALSPSFVFGSIILLNILLFLDILTKEKGWNERFFVSVTLMLLLFELSRTKLSSFVAIWSVLCIFALILLWRNRALAGNIFAIVAVSSVLFFVTSSGNNFFMPLIDFLIGAPLLGYANHLAAILPLPVESLNPISKGLALRWQSILIFPFFIFHFVRFAVLDPKLLSAIIIFVSLRKHLRKEYGKIVWVLVILIPLGFLMPVLYSPAWYPLALSFYAPLVSEQAALLLVALGVGCFTNWKSPGDSQ